jgi:hypothetical protein
MNEEVEKTISGSLEGFQWILAGILLVLILYLILKKAKKN